MPDAGARVWLIERQASRHLGSATRRVREIFRDCGLRHGRQRLPGDRIPNRGIGRSRLITFNRIGAHVSRPRSMRAKRASLQVNSTGTVASGIFKKEIYGKGLATWRAGFTRTAKLPTGLTVHVVGREMCGGCRGRVFRHPFFTRTMRRLPLAATQDGQCRRLRAGSYALMLEAATPRRTSVLRRAARGSRAQNRRADVDVHTYLSNNARGVVDRPRLARPGRLSPAGKATALDRQNPDSGGSRYTTHQSHGIGFASSPRPMRNVRRLHHLPHESASLRERPYPARSPTGSLDRGAGYGSMCSPWDCIDGQGLRAHAVCHGNEPRYKRGQDARALEPIATRRARVISAARASIGSRALERAAGLPRYASRGESVLGRGSRRVLHS